MPLNDVRRGCWRNPTNGIEYRLCTCSQRRPEVTHLKSLEPAMTTMCTLYNRCCTSLHYYTACSLYLFNMASLLGMQSSNLRLAIHKWRGAAASLPSFLLLNGVGYSVWCIFFCVRFRGEISVTYIIGIN
jgi:hypothetical protein